MSIWGHVDRPLHRRTHPPQPGGGAVLRHRGQRTNLARGRRGGGPAAQGGGRSCPTADPGHRALLSRSGGVRLRPTGAPRPGPADRESPSQGARRRRPAGSRTSRTMGMVHPRPRPARARPPGPRGLSHSARERATDPGHDDGRPVTRLRDGACRCGSTGDVPYSKCTNGCQRPGLR